MRDNNDHDDIKCLTGSIKNAYVYIYIYKYYRWEMSTCTPERSAILSLLLDGVVGTKEAIEIRKDFCRIMDAIRPKPIKSYYTGSKAEGLDLPGSDEDFMIDINDQLLINVVQFSNETANTFCNGMFFLCTENVNPGFALLRCINLNPQMNCINVSRLMMIMQYIDGVPYLSSNLLVDFCHCTVKCLHKSWNLTMGRQGPSIEQWREHQNKSISGTDNVPSIHCDFWPNVAVEWTKRSRNYGWPTSRDISTIVEFGCHLVPIGHPASKTKLMEWRLSFSVAERILVWSFNHVQMHCYAVMKIILKEFIKIRCSTQNQFLCSYFVKTFLFWTFEDTELEFWCERNIRECIIFLLTEFSECIRRGVLRHYFIPDFNLFSVKITQEAQTELQQLFDTIIQYDISIFNECQTLRPVWSKFSSANENQMDIIHNERKINLIKDDAIMMTNLYRILDQVNSVDNLCQKIRCTLCAKSKPSNYCRFSIDNLFAVPCKTPLKSIAMKPFNLDKQLQSIVEMWRSGNNDLSNLQQTFESCSFDLLTSTLWYAMVLLKKCEYALCLTTVNDALSSIPPFALLFSRADRDDSQHFYVEKFLFSSFTTMERARKAWLGCIVIPYCYNEILPFALQIEQYFRDTSYFMLHVSPCVCAYYLQFLCFHLLGQHDNRDGSLRQLTELVNHLSQRKISGFIVFNIAGHCLLITGRRDEARKMFIRSRRLTSPYPGINKTNSANWYIENFCWIVR